ncbi:MAG: hypothetical protein ACW99A_03610 [Candidatus Kariarchaeaceae archaeon]|jgi:hypothetical protein
MDIKKFQQHLKGKNINEGQIANAVAIIQDFEIFVSAIKKSFKEANYEDFYKFSREMISKGNNTYENYLHILRYALFIQNNEMITAAMETIDGSEMIKNFSSRLENKHGKPVRDAVFSEIGIPHIGIHPKERPAITMKLIERLIESVGYENAKTFLNVGLRDQYADWYKTARETYLAAGNIDKFLKAKRQNLYQELKKHRDEGTLFYTQVVDDDVLDYVQRRPKTESGSREKNIISVTKIPYNTKRYLEAKKNNDQQKMKYYFCHNPWIREGLLDEEMKINPVACQISCGYYKDYWEGVLGSPVQVELTGSMVLNNKICSFDVYLPMIDSLE